MARKTQGRSPGNGGNRPEDAIDGIGPSGFPNIFHSAQLGVDPSPLLTITFDDLYTVSSVSIFERSGDNNGTRARDVDDFVLRDANGLELASYSGLDANNAGRSVTQTVPAPSISDAGRRPTCTRCAGTKGVTGPTGTLR